MKRGNMRTYGTVLTEKLVSEKCTTRASPCVRYFVDAEGNRITEPEKIATENVYLKPTEYRKRVEGLKRDGKGKFVKKEDNYKAVIGDDECEITSREGTRAPSNPVKDDEGGIVAKGGEKELETTLQYFCFGTYEDNRYDSCDSCDAYDNCKVVTREIKSKDNISDDSEPCSTLLCHSCEEGGCAVEKKGKSREEYYPCFGTYEDRPYTTCGKCRYSEACRVETNDPVGETKDDLGVLAEPEIWPCKPNPEKETPDQMWVHVAYFLGAIKQHGIRQVEEDIQDRINQILGGK